ncbi:uncharacterized protein LOC132644154 [Lycium barbarum]|uniref:uncharacterized protein LOC132644154 n=1 Tax=Lycium barbarum TaxID=112863 RepID=UPI00293EAAB8|nr:uncharacterized protein LOC132644154 [Lycium barbarum]
MLRACVIDFGDQWDQFLPLVKFAYNNSYHSSIYMAPFEALYGRRCLFPIGWFDAFEIRPWGTDLLRDSLDKVFLVFHVSMLNKYHSDGSHVIRRDSVLLDQNLSFEEQPIAILDIHVRKLRSKEIISVKVEWRHCPIED